MVAAPPLAWHGGGQGIFLLLLLAPIPIIPFLPVLIHVLPPIPVPRQRGTARPILSQAAPPGSA